MFERDAAEVVVAGGCIDVGCRLRDFCLFYTAFSDLLSAMERLIEQF